MRRWWWVVVVVGLLRGASPLLATQTPTRTGTRTITSTPTQTSTPTITNTPTLTPTPTVTFIFTNTFPPTETPSRTPSRTQTGTRTIDPTPTETPTSTAVPTCGACLLTGQVFNVDATPAADRRLTIETTKEQIINPNSSHPCLVRISLKTVKLDANGNLQSDATAEAGATIHVTLEDDVPLEVGVPEAATYPLARLIAANTSRPPSDTLRDVTVGSGGQYQLTANHTGKLLTLTTGVVHGFTLDQNVDAGGFKITGLLPATAPGDLMSYGTLATGDLRGTYPNPTIRFFTPSATIPAFPIPHMDPGDCVVRDTMAVGAVLGQAVAISPRTPTNHLNWLAWVPMPDHVRLRVCALSSLTPAPSIYDLRVMQ